MNSANIHHAGVNYIILVSVNPLLNINLFLGWFI